MEKVFNHIYEKSYWDKLQLATKEKVSKSATPYINADFDDSLQPIKVKKDFKIDR